MGGVDKHAVFGALKRRSIRTQVLRSVSELRIKAGDVGAPVRTLSGGNAQRVVIARWLLREPSVLILNGPTVGVDVGSKFDILALLRSMSLQGLAVLLISDDLDELVAVCSQVHVVRRGQIVATLANDQLTTDSLSDAMAAA